ncbi:unnamed protein product [Thlaspi arvense]|uniref:LOB domain-containing protein n=1 Tax=Thlaspi arvense TaxID=13288 RepID=A0AAU9RK68_THLAR|nr:unnamed protein product [Thlaspi arvense]
MLLESMTSTFPLHIQFRRITPPLLLVLNPEMGGNSPCASCKLLRRRCAKECIFAPYFPPGDPHNVFAPLVLWAHWLTFKPIKPELLGYEELRNSELPVHQRGDAVSSLVYEANARMRDPVYGCVGAISYLQNQVSQLEMQLAVAQAEILCIQMQQEPHGLPNQ